jgi:hypothetical protein
MRGIAAFISKAAATLFLSQVLIVSIEALTCPESVTSQVEIDCQAPCHGWANCDYNKDACGACDAGRCAAAASMQCEGWLDEVESRTRLSGS